jgi:cell division protein FtsB
MILQNEARAAHVPETAIREDKDVEAIKKQRAQAQAAQQQMAQQQQAQQTLAQNYDKLSEPPKPGSPAAALFGQGAA